MKKKELFQTPSQTIGPYFAYGLTPEQYRYDFASVIDDEMIDSAKVEITGKVYDGEGHTIPDAMVELWQNDGEHLLIGRCGTGTEPGHRFVFRTIKPKSVDGHAPFITVIVFMRGQLIHSYTRLYFDDEVTLNAQDEVLLAVPKERRKTLLASKVAEGAYTFDIHMQGAHETVFFEI